MEEKYTMSLSALMIKNIGYFPENWELYVENIEDKLVLENEEKDEKIEKMLEYLKEN